MVYYNWRYFYSGESKWLTRDFIPDSLNPYIYCNNNFNKSDFIGLTTIIFSFLRGDVKKYNQLISLIREHNNKINKWIKKIKDKMINVFKITESCRNGMEMFDWVRRQGVTISWNNQPFNDSYEEFIKKVENDKIVHNSITLGKSETLESLSERLAERANQHDKAVVIGHSLYEQSENTGHFIIPRENSRSEYTSHEYFANFTLITCFMGDNNIRMWDYTEPQKRFALKFTPSTPSGCQHIKSGNIYYIPFDIKPKIIGPIMV